MTKSFEAGAILMVFHFPFPGLGRVRQAEDEFSFTAMV
jgi:hypothetical protein